VTVFFVEPAQREYSPLPISGILPNLITWKRATAVALVTVFACLLHCVAFMWYVNRPAPLPVTEAKALPMIDIALEAPSAGTPEVAKPEPPPLDALWHRQADASRGTNPTNRQQYPLRGGKS